MSLATSLSATTSNKEQKSSIKDAVVSAVTSGTVAATVTGATASLLNYACPPKLPVLLITGVLGIHQAIISGLEAYKVKTRLVKRLEKGLSGGYIYLISIGLSEKTSLFSLNKVTTPAVAGYVVAVASGTAVTCYTQK